VQVPGIISGGRGKAPEGAPTGRRRVGVVDGALGPRDRFNRLGEIFPDQEFVLLPPDWDGSGKNAPEILIVGIGAADAESACRWLRSLPVGVKVVVILHDADIASTRSLLRDGGAADVLPAPVSEPSLAASLERLLSSPVAGGGSPRRDGRVVAFLKAGGGVGATALAVQAGAILARRDGGAVCLADLDLQFGAASAYLDLPDAITVMDCLSAGTAVAQTPFATSLATHASGLRLLAGPTDMMPLEAISPAHVEGLLQGLRRDMALTLLDLPSAWTAWTHHALQQADRIVIVTRLTVPHMQQVRRQLRTLMQQHLDTVPVTIVCNAVSGEAAGALSVKAAAKALGRPFDYVIPEDERVMTAAVNEGVELATVKRGTKLEKAVAEFAHGLAADALAPAQKRRGW
jgi:pilus assembly protein CpaE